MTDEPWQAEMEKARQLLDSLDAYRDGRMKMRDAERVIARALAERAAEERENAAKLVDRHSSRQANAELATAIRRGDRA